MPRKREKGQEKSRKVALPVVTPENLPFQILLLVQSLTKKMQAVLRPFDLTPLHWGILCCLWEQDGLATQAISTRLEQLGGTITIGLDTMEKRGFVRRQSDERDQRISRVYLTERGSGLESVLIPRVHQLIEAIFASTSASEYRALTRSVKQLRKHLSEM